MATVTVFTGMTGAVDGMPSRAVKTSIWRKGNSGSKHYRWTLQALSGQHLLITGNPGTSGDEDEAREIPSVRKELNKGDGGRYGRRSKGSKDGVITTETPDARRCRGEEMKDIWESQGGSEKTLRRCQAKAELVLAEVESTVQVLSPQCSCRSSPTPSHWTTGGHELGSMHPHYFLGVFPSLILAHYADNSDTQESSNS
ncbi:hypothetical protein C8R46DRAFT_1037830 [Mycena filopes]|nr:hypothetical protein C8R46DRAFT_1037827 [Mycena filopes]KAJ7161628.1 hypothetical protein C8R46DRAFT_1037830 [Mycena filopes]